MKGIDRKIKIEFKSSNEGNILSKRIILRKGLICAIIYLSFLFSGKTAAINVNDSYHSETVTTCETVKQGFDFKTSVLISIGLGASFSIVHMDNRKIQKYS